MKKKKMRTMYNMVSGILVIVENIEARVAKIEKLNVVDLVAPGVLNPKSKTKAKKVRGK